MDTARKQMYKEFYAMHTGVNLELRCDAVERREDEEFRLGQSHLCNPGARD